MRAKRPERVHLLEQRREILGLGGRRELAQLDEPSVVVGEGLGKGRIRLRPPLPRLGPERAVDDLEELQLFTNDTGPLFVGLETGDGQLFGSRFGDVGQGNVRT